MNFGGPWQARCFAPPESLTHKSGSGGFNFMRKFLFAICLVLLAARGAHAQCIVTASITITNLSTNGVFFTVNGVTRTFTNAPLNGASWVLTNSDVTGSGSKTNLFANIGLNPYPLVNEADTGSNTFNLISAVSANCVNPLVLSMSTSLGSFSYSTQTVSQAIDRRVPYTIESAAIKTNVVNDEIQAINDPAATNQFNQNGTAMFQEVGTSNVQTIYGAKFFKGVLTATNPILENPTSTNLLNYGNAIASYGNGIGAQQFGESAVASGSESTALGESTLATAGSATAIGALSTASGATSTALGTAVNATGVESTAVGANSTASAFLSTALGSSATASATNSLSAGFNASASGFNSIAIGEASSSIASNSVAVGTGTTAGGTNSIAVGTGAFSGTNGSTALGNGANANWSNSTALGAGASNTAPNQVMLGSASSTAWAPNNLVVTNNENVNGNLAVNGTFQVTGNVIQLLSLANGLNMLPQSPLVLNRHVNNSLANGNNADVSTGTNVYLDVSGPTGAFSIAGFTPISDGYFIIVKNSTGQTMTIANQSGIESVPQSRIITGIGADEVFTNNTGIVSLIYDGSVNRWVIAGHN